MFIYTMVLTVQVINKQGANTTLGIIYRNLEKDHTDHVPGDGSFVFLVGISDPDGYIFYNESIAKIEMYHGKKSTNGSQTNSTLSRLETMNCDQNTLKKIYGPVTTEEDITRCLVHDNYTLSGTDRSSSFKYLTVVIRRCSPDQGDEN